MNNTAIRNITNNTPTIPFPMPRKRILCLPAGCRTRLFLYIPAESNLSQVIKTILNL